MRTSGFSTGKDFDFFHLTLNRFQLAYKPINQLRWNTKIGIDCKLQIRVRIFFDVVNNLPSMF
jgi:hypothetical protein